MAIIKEEQTQLTGVEFKDVINKAFDKSDKNGQIISGDIIYSKEIKPSVIYNKKIGVDNSYSGSDGEATLYNGIRLECFEGEDYNENEKTKTQMSGLYIRSPHLTDNNNTFVPISNRLMFQTYSEENNQLMSYPIFGKHNANSEGILCNTNNSITADNLYIMGTKSCMLNGGKSNFVLSNDGDYITIGIYDSDNSSGDETGASLCLSRQAEPGNNSLFLWSQKDSSENNGAGHAYPIFGEHNSQEEGILCNTNNIMSANEIIVESKDTQKPSKVKICNFGEYVSMVASKIDTSNKDTSLVLFSGDKIYNNTLQMYNQTENKYYNIYGEHNQQVQGFNIVIDPGTYSYITILNTEALNTGIKMVELITMQNYSVKWIDGGTTFPTGYGSSCEFNGNSIVLRKENSELRMYPTRYSNITIDQTFYCGGVIYKWQ